MVIRGINHYCGGAKIQSVIDSFHWKIKIFTDDFYPHLPNYLESAKVIAIMGGLTRVAKYQVVVLNKGADDGLEVGHVLAIATYQSKYC
ncbi:MAG: hypothetical protein R3E08_03125 [Thiotrichaceae bacterium]